MRHIILTVLTSLTVHFAIAKCGSSNISSLPNGTTLHKKGMIVLEFYAASQSLIKDLNTRYPVYLKSTHRATPLEVVEILKGEMELTQVVLKPTQELNVGEVYTFQMDNLPTYELQPGRFNKVEQKWEPISYKIIDTIGNVAPVIHNTPTLIKKTMVSYGCGPARWVYFKVSGAGSMELFARTAVKNKTTGYTTTYLLPIENGEVRVGHGMCSGSFHFSLGDTFEVTFQLVDQAGNKSKITNSLVFSKPMVLTEDE